MRAKISVKKSNKIQTKNIVRKYSVFSAFSKYSHLFFEQHILLRFFRLLCYKFWILTLKLIRYNFDCNLEWSIFSP